MPWDERERDFLQRLTWQRRDPTDAQVRWLSQLAARREANGPATPDVVIAAFLDAMRASGIVPLEHIAGLLGPKRIRFQIEGDSKGKRTGWAKLYLDEHPAGSFGSYRGETCHKWRFGAAVDPAAAAAWERTLTERRRQRESELLVIWERVAAWAGEAWERAGSVDPAHAYLVSKALPGEGLRQLGPALLMPMRDAAGRIWNCQRLYAGGRKLFGPPGAARGEGGRTEGLFFLCGDPDAALCVGEGWATVAAVRFATGHAVAAAITGGNLEPVARALRAMFPDVDMIICADDDAALERHPKYRRNLGVDYARAAALAVGGRLAMPPRRAIAA